MVNSNSALVPPIDSPSEPRHKRRKVRGENTAQAMTDEVVVDRGFRQLPSNLYPQPQQAKGLRKVDENGCNLSRRENPTTVSRPSPTNSDCRRSDEPQKCYLLLSDVASGNYYRAEVCQRNRIAERTNEVVKIQGFEELSVQLSSSKKTVTLEAIRLEAQDGYFRAGRKHLMRIQAVQLAIQHLLRLLTMSKIHNMPLNDAIYTAAVVTAAWGLSVKCVETPKKETEARDYDFVVSQVVPAALREEVRRDFARYRRLVTTVEVECCRMFASELKLPLSVEFFDDYLMVGEWPSHVGDKARQLGHYLTCLSSFASGSNMREKGLLECDPSVVAAAALALSVKIVGNEEPKEAFEYYPERVARYAGYTLDQINAPMIGLKQLLRRKPAYSLCLGEWYQDWGSVKWN